MVSPPKCPQCHRGLPADLLNVDTVAPCHSCGTPLQVEVFPALFRERVVGQAGESVMMDGEATCFYHAEKRAVLPCGSCGRFMCALCDCEINGAHFCPTCLEKGKTTGKIKNLDDKRTCYDTIALSLALLPILLLWPVTFATAPAALFMAIRYWKAPRSILHRTRIRLVLTMVFASIQVIAWVVAVAFLVSGMASDG